MVKRIKEEGMAGAREFEGLSKDDPQLQVWLDEHRARNGGKVRVGLGGRGVRAIFARESDMAFWKARFDKAQPGAAAAR
jgi:hypothetical protein